MEASSVMPRTHWFFCRLARVSMPGMMDTVPNLGLNDDRGSLIRSGTPFVWDSYRRHSDVHVVMGDNLFEEPLKAC